MRSRALILMVPSGVMVPASGSPLFWALFWELFWEPFFPPFPLAVSSSECSSSTCSSGQGGTYDR
jgi:hypothetical protein